MNDEETYRVQLTLDEIVTVLTALKVADDKVTQKHADAVERKLDTALGAL